jgi:hypothetical protein
MKTIEIKTQTDNSGKLKIEVPMHFRNKKVRIFIFPNDDDEFFEDEKMWLQANATNPVFDFLNEPEENVYTLNSTSSGIRASL